MGSALNLALPDIGKAFTMSAVTLAWVSTSYLISTAVFQVPFARLADLVGRKKIFIAGVSLFSVCTFLCGVAASSFQLILLRALSGLGSAMMFGTNVAILTSLFPRNERGKVLGISTSVVYFALASGPFFGGMLTHYFGWRTLFLICTVMGFVVVFAGLKFLKGEWIEAKGEKFDFAGATVYALGLFGLIYGFSKLPSSMGFACIILGLITLSLFVIWEKRCAFPVFNVDIFSGNRIFSLSSLAALINYAATSATAFVMSLYLQHIRGFDAQQAGFILIPQACVQSLVSLYSGRLSDKFPAPVLATTGMAVIVAGLTGLVFITPYTSMFFIITLLILLGVGFGLFSSPNVNIIMSSVDKKYYGQASATTGTMRLTGQAFSMGIAIMAIALQVGGKAITPDVHPQFMRSLHITFAICAGLCLLGAYASSFRVAKTKK
jgi:EmrB/QacA subfamily drug resistance transporter